MADKSNPADHRADEQAGLAKARWAAVQSETNSTNIATPEAIAIAYVQARYRVSECMARVFVTLAGLGGRLA